MIVYVTGGIGSGKSTALRLLAAHGARVERADDIVHELLAQPAVQREVAEALGVPDAADRQAIAEVVFKDELKLRTLEGILHPRVGQEVRRRAAASSEPLVFEVPLLPTPAPGDLVVTIDAPDDVRMSRLLSRGMTTEDAERRMALQPSRAAYRERATVIIDNSGSEADLEAALSSVWKDVLRGASNV